MADSLADMAAGCPMRIDRDVVPYLREKFRYHEFFDGYGLIGVFLWLCSEIGARYEDARCWKTTRYLALGRGWRRRLFAYVDPQNREYRLKIGVFAEVAETMRPQTVSFAEFPDWRHGKGCKGIIVTERQPEVVDILTECCRRV